MKLLSTYFDLQEQIFAYFGYREDWVKIPLDDRTDANWILLQEPDGSGHVIYHESELTPEFLDSGEFYHDTIYTQRFLPKWVYVGVEYTMVVVDTHTDGNKFLGIYDNTKRVTPSAEQKRAIEKWLGELA